MRITRGKLLVLPAVIFVICAPAFCQYSGGDGTSGNPYRIGNISDWQTLMSHYGDWGKSFIMTADINLSGVTLTPVGNTSKLFTGVFDGNDHIISRVTINRSSSDYVGLFGYIGGGRICKLKLEDVAITGRSKVGGLAGYNGGTITSCSINGMVSGNNYIGGLAGYNWGTIENSCCNVTVTATSSYAGGLVGYNNGKITSCYCSGTINGNSYVGGLAGYQTGTNVQIENSYSIAKVVATSSNVGGLIGSVNGGYVISCYATGQVNGTNLIGGFVGSNLGNVKGCFWNEETSGLTASEGGKGITTEQMKRLTVFQNAGWADKGWVIKDGLDYPRLSWENTNGLPIPAETISFAGSGSDEDPYQIWTADDFAQLSWQISVLDKNIILMANLDLHDVKLDPIGDLGLPFTGIFDGNAHVISNAVINEPNNKYVGLFSRIDSSGEIRNLSVEDINIIGGNYVGGLVGYALNIKLTGCYASGWVSGGEKVGGLAGSIENGTITDCNSNLKVSGTGNFIGGIIGYDDSSSLISCYASGLVTGKDYVGGLLGCTDNGMITECNSIATVNGTNNVGGLVGYNTNYSVNISNCFAAGSVSGNNSVGGLIGYNYGRLISCWTNGQTIGTGTDVGGVVGYNFGGSLTYCYADGSITGLERVGGLVGSISGWIAGCYASAEVKGKNVIGGLVGYNSSSSSISSCWTRGSVAGTEDSAGGLVGSNNGVVSSCYASGSIMGASKVGGLVGDNKDYGKITYCYSSGSVKGDYNIGGLVGQNSCISFIGNFWDMESSGLTTSSSGKGLITEQMRKMAIFQNAGWANKGWVMEDGLDYPRLSWENTAGTAIPEPLPVPLLGSGSEPDPYQIWTADDFAQLSWHAGVLDKHIILMEDLDLNDVQLYPIGDLGDFTGMFEGNDHVISNADINQPGSNYVGLFSINLGGKICNLGIEDVNINGGSNVGGLAGYNGFSSELTACYVRGSVNGTGNNVGGLTGYTNGALSDCNMIGSVKGKSYIGGLVGNTDISGKATNCYVKGSVQGDDYVGGLVGYNVAMVTDCYAKSLVEGNEKVGGLAGYNDRANLTNCYAKGSINGYNSVGGLVGYNATCIMNCFADGSVSGDSDIGGLVGFQNFGCMDTCFAMGSVSGGESIGGLVGRNRGSIRNCYARSTVSGNEKIGGLIGNGAVTIIKCYATGLVSGDNFVGGLVGYDDLYDYYTQYKATASFWDEQTSGQASAVGYGSSDGISSKITSEMQDITTFLNSGWDFSGESANGTANIWHMPYGASGYPMLYWQRDIIGDIGGKYGVGPDDFSILAVSWRSQDGDGNFNPACDISQPSDGVIDESDLAVLAENWLVQQ